jgi:Kef-type K+ transport system membrane component KefB
LVSIVFGYRGIQAISAACAFAPTSLGIAMNVLRQFNIANTPIGQLIVAAAIIDDMIALVILSQLQAFTGAEITVVDIIVPVISALGFLGLGGYIGIFVAPKILNLILDGISKTTDFSRGWVSLCALFLLLLVLSPTTFYCKASPLMGAFLAGLCFCSDHSAHHAFVTQLKRPMQWMLRIFFAASIGFQVPITRFTNTSVLLQGLALSLALIGKVAVGFLAPNFSLTRRFYDMHLRDCLVVGK